MSTTGIFLIKISLSELSSTKLMSALKGCQLKMKPAALADIANV
jgi:hypothetical protein